MMRIYKGCLAFLSLILFVSFNAVAQSNITVAVAANMQYASEALKAAFEHDEQIKVTIIIGSSGKLTQQIMTSAPFDVFVSADTSFPQKLFEGNFAAEKPRVYAQGLLVVWTLKKNVQLKSNLQFLLAGNIKSIAIANPKNAPYGSAAEALLKKYNLYESLKGKLVFGESITQTSQFIATEAADVGFTAKAIVLSKEMQGKGVWIDLNREDYPPIRQSAVLLKHSQQNQLKAAKKFYDFLYSAKAKDILRKFGYVINGK